MRGLFISSTSHWHPRRGGFTLVEIMLVVLIMAIIAVMGIDAIAEFDAAQRADRAARESLAFFRFARTLAMTTGKKAKVAVDTTNRTLSVYWQSNGTSYDATPYAVNMTATGTSVLNLNNARDLVGTTIALNPPATTYFEYSALGTCAQTGTVNFSYAGKTKGLAIANVGDPQIQ